MRSQGNLCNLLFHILFKYITKHELFLSTLQNQRFFILYDRAICTDNEINMTFTRHIVPTFQYLSVKAVIPTYICKVTRAKESVAKALYAKAVQDPRAKLSTIKSKIKVL